MAQKKTISDELVERLLGSNVSSANLQKMLEPFENPTSIDDSTLLVRRLLTRPIVTHELMVLLRVLESVDERQQRCTLRADIVEASAPQRSLERVDKREPVRALQTVGTRSRRDVSAVWAKYKTKPTARLRNVLVEHYFHLVRYNAERIYVKLPSGIRLDDLLSAGVLGLMDAIDGFDADRGVRFETYCAPRIRGAILNELRSLDWVPRLVRARAETFDAAASELQAQLGRRPTMKELAHRLSVSTTEVAEIEQDATAVRDLSSDKTSKIDTPPENGPVDPVQDAQRRELMDLIRKGLSRVERLIVILFYYEEMTMTEIGATLDLSEARVREMHNSILARLKAQLQQREVAMIA